MLIKVCYVVVIWCVVKKAILMQSEMEALGAAHLLDSSSWDGDAVAAALLESELDYFRSLDRQEKEEEPNRLQQPLPPPPPQ